MCSLAANVSKGLAQQKPKQKGFTLVELVIVIVLLGIISVGVTGFIVNSVEGYSDLARRDGIAATSRVAMDRMVRELRNSLPNSARVSGSCLEYIPILDATSYISIPVSSSANTLSIIPFSEAPELGKTAVYPISSNVVYQVGSPGVISPNISSTASTLLGPGATTLSLVSAHQYLTESPSKRLYIVANPISYCLEGDRLYRYSNYGRSATQATPATLPAILPTTEPDRVLLAYPVTASTGPFTVVSATLQRNALVMLEFSVEQDSESLLIQQEVQIRNAP
jgi:MSHA biogenesis protein MshO